MSNTRLPLREAPVRLCCLQRHWGPICPDGKVMCCLCFERFEIEDLTEAENGQKQDVCRDCAAMEAKAREALGA